MVRWPAGMAQAIAALIKDLKQRGLLDDTIVLWTTEFGRMPCAQSGKGRDHNPFVFTNWLCGGGIKRRRRLTGSAISGATNRSIASTPRRSTTSTPPCSHLLGHRPQKLTFRHNGIDRRLTDVHGEVIHPLLA